MRVVAMAMSIALFAACGDDAPPTPPPKPGTATAPAAGGAGAGSNGPKLVPQAHVEQVVRCPVRKQVDKADKDEKSCDPKAAVSGCGEHRFCLDVGGTGFFCEKCPERETIRHVFSERDFIGDATQNRDPFHSYLVPDINQGKDGDKSKAVGKCNEKQMKIPNYSYADLKLVGIVSQGTNRKVLLMAGNYGTIIHKGECVGKEKAYVKEIGASYVTFQLQDQLGKGHEPEERSIQLYPNSLPVGYVAGDAGPDAVNQTPQTTAPIEAPPTQPVAPTRTPTRPQQGSGETTITPKTP
jgi:Tfp pilus assembly protein PilP